MRGRSAVVRWQTGGVIGICFDSEPDARDVTALIACSIALDARMKTGDSRWFPGVGFPTIAGTGANPLKEICSVHLL